MTTRRSPSHIIPKAFPGIRAGEIQELVTNSQIRTYDPGTVLCQEDMIEQVFYMLLEGEVEVTKTINKSEKRLLKVLMPGDFFGEMGLIHNAPRAASVTAKTRVIVLELEKEAFDAVLKQSSSVSLAMVREISNRLRQNDEMAVEDLRLRAGELARAYQQLAEQDLARREFLSSVAHELRTPLMAANGYLQLVQKDAIPRDQLPGAIDTIARNVQQIVKLVNDILFLQELDLVLPEFQEVNLQEIAESVQKQYKEKARDGGIHLYIRSERGIPNISGDPKSLERVLSALIENAIKFSPKGGDVIIWFKRKPGQIILAVEDHGIGIEPELIPQIFNRFYHLDKKEDDLFGGLGLGLAITRQVIKQHDGNIGVESKPGQGSTFTITLKSS
ncbi:MAG: cyclic nucleotide-binding domain-containing protein [Anaerolineales bacterium]|nr:cyclic nucleotide-binding domain-containing protein [Anaerolineales bacterium]